MAKARVSFGALEGARDPLVDERDVMKKFNSHVRRCDTCHDSLSSWRADSPLCSRGHGYVIDMSPYFFCKSGKPYSLIDRTKRDEQNRVLVPPEYRHVNTLFEALDHGYSTNPARQSTRPRPVVLNHNRPTATRASRAERPRLDPIVIPAAPLPISSQYSARVSPNSRSPRYYEETPRRYREPRRGSLYHEDERRRNRRGEEVIVVSPERYYR